MAFSLPNLPYAYNSLEPSVDAQTMEIHHSKHHNTYVTNLNNAVANFPEFKDVGIVDLNKKLASNEIPASIAGAVRNSGGGHYNHSFFWKVMTNPSNTNGPNASLKKAIDESFGSFEQMKEKFTAAAVSRFGSGWAWLNCTKDGKLEITSTANQVLPL